MAGQDQIGRGEKSEPPFTAQLGKEDKDPSCTRPSTLFLTGQRYFPNAQNSCCAMMAHTVCPPFLSAIWSAPLKGGSVRLNRVPSFSSGVSACCYAACLTAGSITADASSGVFLPNFEGGLDRLYQTRYCMIDLSRRPSPKRADTLARLSPSSIIVPQKQYPARLCVNPC